MDEITVQCVLAFLECFGQMRFEVCWCQGTTSHRTNRAISNDPFEHSS